MTYSTKQKLFAEFMLKKIGFTQPEQIEQYLIQLENIFGPWSEWTNSYGYTNLSYSVIKEQSGLNIAATDLSNYVYCPVSYSIGKSFKINNPTGQGLSNNGISLHEQLKLIGKKIPHDLKETEAHKSSVFQDDVIEKIRSSQIVFIGHSEDKQYFINEDAKFTGQPDYIFKDDEGKYFAVEEKFHSLKPRGHNYWKESYKQYQNLTNRFLTTIKCN